MGGREEGTRVVAPRDKEDLRLIAFVPGLQRHGQLQPRLPPGDVCKALLEGGRKEKGGRLPDSQLRMSIQSTEAGAGAAAKSPTSFHQPPPPFTFPAPFPPPCTLSRWP